METVVITPAKKDDTTLVIEKVVTSEMTTNHEYKLDFLLKQKIVIQTQKDRDNALRDAELKEVNDLIKNCTDLGIKEAVDVKPVIDEVIIK